MHDRKITSPTPSGNRPHPSQWEAERGQGPLPAFITAHPDGITLDIQLQPRAAKSKIDGPQGPKLRIRVTAPPVDAAANEALLCLLADVVDCPRRQVEIVRGHKSRRKVVKVYGVTAAYVLEKLGVGSWPTS